MQCSSQVIQPTSICFLTTFSMTFVTPVAGVGTQIQSNIRGRTTPTGVRRQLIPSAPLLQSAATSPVRVILDQPGRGGDLDRFPASSPDVRPALPFWAVSRGILRHIT